MSTTSSALSLKYPCKKHTLLPHSHRLYLSHTHLPLPLTMSKIKRPSGIDKEEIFTVKKTTVMESAA